MATLITCKYCRGPIDQGPFSEILERVTEICTDCWETNEEAREESETAFKNYLEERYETREANSRG